MSNRIDLMNQGMLDKISKKVSDTSRATKISMASTTARKNVAASLTAAAPGEHWRKRERRSPTRNDATLMASRMDAKSIRIRPGDDINPKMTLADLGVCAAENIPAAKAPQRSIFPIFFVT